jgi:hypothetical protein
MKIDRRHPSRNRTGEPVGVRAESGAARGLGIADDGNSKRRLQGSRPSLRIPLSQDLAPGREHGTAHCH